MKTKIRKELEKSVMEDDMLGFKKELAGKLERMIMNMSSSELWPIFQKAAGNSGIDWETLVETVHDDGLDFSSRTRRIKSRVVDHFVDEILNYIRKRRGALRFDFEKAIDIYQLDSLSMEPLRASASNISKSGLLFRYRRPFEKGVRLEMRVHPENFSEPVKIYGSVVRSQSMFSRLFDTGVNISLISEHNGPAVRPTAEDVYRLTRIVM